MPWLGVREEAFLGADLASWRGSRMVSPTRTISFNNVLPAEIKQDDSSCREYKCYRSRILVRSGGYRSRSRDHGPGSHFEVPTRSRPEMITKEV